VCYGDVVREDVAVVATIEKLVLSAGGGADGQADRLFDIVRGMLVCDDVQAMFDIFSAVFALFGSRTGFPIQQKADGLAFTSTRCSSTTPSIGTSLNFSLPPKSMTDVRSLGGHEDSASFRCAREFLEALGYDLAEGFYFADLRRVMKEASDKRDFGLATFLSWKYEALKPLIDKRSELDHQLLQAALSDDTLTSISSERD
jgi:hypothetical protein